VERNITNIDFSVEEMSHALHLSRAGLYKKIFALTGKTPIEFVREIRLQKAAKLLENTNLTISEIAYEVGFNPKSFTKNFKSLYKMLPSEYQEINQNKV
jgi:AraC-like DNA-binding protein